MNLTLIYPRWPKLERQTEFHLPPHGPVVFAAEVPRDVEIRFIDENFQAVNPCNDTDLVALSVMLTCQVPRAIEIADKYRETGVPVIFGGIATMLHKEELLDHSDSIFLGEVEGRFASVIEDFKNNSLKKIYDYMNNLPDISLVNTARREILNPDFYTYRGVKMLDLVHASRGCIFNCFPCCVGYLGGRVFRPRPVEKVIEEMNSIRNNRMFIVDNSLAQDRDWLKELFTAMIPLKKTWVSHPVMDDDEILRLAKEAGCWYVYQAIVNTSDGIRNRVKRLKDHGIGVEGTILLGTDDQSEDDIKRLVDFLLEIELDMAEFTILTPFPHSPIREEYEKEGRILSNNWLDYTCDRVVYKPKKMSPDTLVKMYHYAWDIFYYNTSPSLKMSFLFKKAVMSEMEKGTYRQYNPRKARSFAGRTVNE
jgi:radical SAM superfamily enzyme YgiQ (UPF0313 family)